MSPTSKNGSIAEIETDLINCLLRSPTIDYPWNPTDPDTADYYIRSDRNLQKYQLDRRHRSIDWRWQSRLMNWL
jgi:hypothetical protein